MAERYESPNWKDGALITMIVVKFPDATVRGGGVSRRVRVLVDGECEMTSGKNLPILTPKRARGSPVLFGGVRINLLVDSEKGRRGILLRPPVQARRSVEPSRTTIGKSSTLLPSC